MQEPQDSPSDRELLHSLITRLDQIYRPGVRLQSLLDAVLQGLQEQWPDLTRGEIYLRGDGADYRRQAAFGLPAGLPPTPAANFPAARVLIESKPVHFKTEEDTICWALPLSSGGDQPIGILQLEGPAGIPDVETLTPALAALMSVLGHTIDRLSTITHQDEELFAQTAASLKEVLQADQQRTVYEEALGKITAHLQQQTDLSLILQQTLHELGQVLGARRARVRLQVLPSGTGDPGIPSR